MQTVMPSFRSLFVVAPLVLGLGACGEEQAPPEPRTPAAPSMAVRKGNGAEPARDAARAPSTREQTPVAAADNAARMAPTPATVLRATELKDKPFIDAKTLQRLPAQTRVTVIDRSGGWLKVARDDRQGWVRLLHVSSQPSASGGTAQELESVAKMATGRGGSGNIVNTTGIRGLSEEQLRAAKPSPAELQRLESYGVEKERAAAYARQHKLERRQVAQLPEPR